MRRNGCSDRLPPFTTKARPILPSACSSTVPTADRIPKNSGWLALLELLYREKFASDYVVNAKWFRQYHPESSHWDEVLRIGYLLDPLEPLFTVAVHWSHDEPVAGIWLPSNPGDKKPVSPPPHLKLEFVK